MVYVLLALIMLGVWLFCLFDVLGTAEADVRSLPKFGWFLIVLLGFWIGAALWLLFGRARKAPVLPASPPALDQEPPRGPDDDPDFLRNLERRIKGED
jgi:Phospholipase_D-nuclease N-terminal